MQQTDEQQDVGEQGFYAAPIDIEYQTIVRNSSKHIEPIIPPQRYASLINPKMAKFRSAKLASKRSNQVLPHKNNSAFKNKTSTIARFSESESEEEEVEEKRTKTVVKNKVAEERKSSRTAKQETKTVVKSKRGDVGVNVYFKFDEEIQGQQIFEALRHLPNGKLVYRDPVSSSSYQFFRKILSSQSKSFLQHPFNEQLLRKVLRYEPLQSCQTPCSSQVVFRSGFESANLHTCLQVGENEYNLYLRIDTNTRGHQNWFNFDMTNTVSERRRVKLNICNLRRNFKMVQQGQKVYVRNNQQSGSRWVVLEEDLMVTPGNNREYKLSFSLTMEKKSSLQISLVPSYTYSDLLEELTRFSAHPACSVTTLSHSLSGLAIPLVTITNQARAHRKLSQPKKCIIISGRVHPSQTCSSFIISGIIQKLLSNTPQMQDILNKVVFQIVPMTNPDGVVFGNFRTNALGDDLNRMFHQVDQLIYPEVTALKELGNLCRQKYGDNLVTFIDVHGHSSQPNSFVYGPQFDQNTEEFIECRMLPKILDSINPIFRYDKSTFRLEAYKANTARGFFFRRLRVPSYTIETSYGLYSDKNDSKNVFNPITVENWETIGQDMVIALSKLVQYHLLKDKAKMKFQAKKGRESKRFFSRDNRSHSLVNHSLGDSESIEFQLIKQQIAREGERRLESLLLSKQGSDTESDGEGFSEDLPLKDREMVIRPMKETQTQTSSELIRNKKNSIMLPTIAPSVFVFKKNREEAVAVPRVQKQKNKSKPEQRQPKHSDYTNLLVRRIKCFQTVQSTDKFMVLRGMNKRRNMRTLTEATTQK